MRRGHYRRSWRVGTKMPLHFDRWVSRRILATAVGLAAVFFQPPGLLGSMPHLRARTCRSAVLPRGPVGMVGITGSGPRAKRYDLFRSALKKIRPASGTDPVIGNGTGTALLILAISLSLELQMVALG